MDTELQKFYEDFESTVAGPVFWPRLSELNLLPDDYEVENLFPVVFQFNSLADAFTNMSESSFHQSLAI